MTEGALRLAQLQNSDGGWDWPLDDGNPAAGSDYATFASAAMGLVKAYGLTGEVGLIAPFQWTKLFLLGKIDNFEVGDGALAVEIDRINGDSVCTTHIRTNFYDKLAAGTYYDSISGSTHNTFSYIQALRNRRTGSLSNLAAWDLGMGLYSAHMVGATTPPWITALEAEIDEITLDGGYDVIGLAGAVLGLAAAGEDYDPQAGPYAGASSLADLAEILAWFQLDSGGFTWHGPFMSEGDENIRETAYAVMALARFDRTGFAQEINDAVIYLQKTQLVTDGWENTPGSGETNEVTGEAVTALGVLAPIIGDFDVDGDTDLLDYSSFAAAWRSTPADPQWNPDCDLADPPDGIINELDLAVFIDNYLAEE
jgi:hypothetical protein